MKKSVARYWLLVAREGKTTLDSLRVGIGFLRATSDEPLATVFPPGKTLCH